ncbi:MAG TPA: cupin domain-containing protein [Chthoniobacterales bacterium]|nr:cupin domain-containing protein [Chthoniobacterales bacterium]
MSNISEATEWFEVLQTSERTQTAIMTLKPGDESGPTAEAHDKSDQVLLMLEGELNGEVGEERPRLQKGDIILIPAGTRHRFTNHGSQSAITFNVYSPPAYSPGSKG